MVQLNHHQQDVALSAKSVVYRRRETACKMVPKIPSTSAVALLECESHSRKPTKQRFAAGILSCLSYFCFMMASAADAQRVAGMCVEENPREERFASTKVQNVISVTENKVYRLRLYGVGFSDNMLVKFTESDHAFGSDCEMDSMTHSYPVNIQNDLTGTVDVDLPKPANLTWYLCINSGTSGHQWIHQGDASWLRIAVVAETSPYTVGSLPLQVVLVAALLLVSGLFAGLILGLMSLDITELKMIENSGTRKERKYARRIRPLRETGNLLLCTLVLGNAMINSSLPILFDNLTGSGLYAVISATVGITIFGEILPQALCSRYGLAIGAHTFWLTKCLMIVTFVLAWPISKVLDLVLGEEIGAVYNRERLAELIKLSHEHDKLASDEAHIIAGALELKTKTAGEIMTPLADVFMIPANAVLNFSSVSEIMRQGYTRIPVYETTPDNIVALLNIKDLCLVDPDDNTPVLTLCKFYNHHVHFVLDDTTLDVLLDTFRRGQTHLALVQRIETAAAGDRDPEYQTVGVVTLEDVIEEIIQAEIVDESDLVSSDPRRHAMRTRHDMASIGANKDFSVFHSNYAASLITPQLQLAAFQFLSAAVEHFRSDLITPTILHRLINHLDVAVSFHLRSEISYGTDLTTIPLIYQSGKPCDFFVLVLEGRVEVKCGKEGITFHGGPFSYFGISALTIGRQDEDLYVRARGESSANDADVPSTAAVANGPHSSTDAVAPADDVTRNSTTVTGRIPPPAPPALQPPGTTSEKFPLINSDKNTKTIKEHSVTITTYNSSDAGQKDGQIANNIGDAVAFPTASGDPTVVPPNSTDAAQQQQQYQTVLSRTDLVGETSQPFVPDYDVRPVSDLLYLRISRAHYIAAFRASQYERKTQDRSERGGMRSAVEYFRSEFDKFSHHKHHGHHHHVSHGGSAGGGGGGVSTAAATADSGAAPSGPSSIRAGGRQSLATSIAPPAGAALFRPPSQVDPPLPEQELRPSSSAGGTTSADDPAIVTTTMIPSNQSTQINNISRQLLQQHRQPSLAGSMQYLSLQQNSMSGSGNRSPKVTGVGSGSIPTVLPLTLPISRQHSSSSSSFVMGGAANMMLRDSEPVVTIAMDILPTVPLAICAAPHSSPHPVSSPTPSSVTENPVNGDARNGDNESDVRLSEKGRRTHEKLVKQGQVDNWSHVPSISVSDRTLPDSGSVL